ncbi:unnamed protein product [Closterium sp. NIES-53]
MAVCQLAEGVKEHRFGGGLKPVEQQWVVGQIGELGTRFFPSRFQNGEPMAVCQLAEGVKEHRFGGGLKPVEQQWVVGQIGEFLGIGFGGVLGVDEEASRRGGRNNWSDDEEW